TLREMIRGLQLPRESRGLDAGCGVGLQCMLFAEEIGPGGHITGVDVSAEMLDYGRKMVFEAGLTAQIAFQEADIANLPFDDNTFDWIWSTDCVGYGPWETMKLLKEMVRVVKPGGVVAIAAWSSEKLLPGYPMLEARLGATASGIAPFRLGRKPELHFHRSLGWFQELGLNGLKAQSFTGSVHAPLDDRVRKALVDLFEMRWPDVQSELSSDDLAEFRRLCLPDSPDFILNLPDYFAFFVYTMFWGKKACTAQ
ncbi:MAG: class I SAM-dependent methyltransferase, partial [Dehalococcoidia bacterium]